MALNKATLKNNLKTRMQAVDPMAVNASDKIAEIISDEIDTFIKSATVTVSAGIAVSVTGSAVAQTGATTAPGTATIS